VRERERVEERRGRSVCVYVCVVLGEMKKMCCVECNCVFYCTRGRRMIVVSNCDLAMSS